MSAPAPARLFEVDPLVQCRPASASRRVLAVLVDAPFPLLAVAGSILAFALDAPGAGWALAALAVVLVVGILVLLALTGRTPGRRLAATRTVERRSGVAAGAGLLRAMVTGRLVTVDLAGGRDPYAPALAPLRFPEPAAAPPVGRAPSAVPVAVLDSGERLPVTAALILGRKPAAPPDAPADTYQWPDLSRTLSKSHARLEWDGEHLWAIDLGSTNGTLLLDVGVAAPLLPFQRTAIRPGAALELGERRVRIERAP